MTEFCWSLASRWQNLKPTTFLGPSQTSLSVFAKILTGFWPLTIWQKSSLVNIWQGSLLKSDINPFVSNAPFLYPLKTLENLTLCWCFQGVEKGCSGNQLVKICTIILTWSCKNYSNRTCCPHCSFAIIVSSEDQFNKKEDFNRRKAWNATGFIPKCFCRYQLGLFFSASTMT